jgi:hypothetical protein
VFFGGPGRLTVNVSFACLHGNSVNDLVNLFLVLYRLHLFF